MGWTLTGHLPFRTVAATPTAACDQRYPEGDAHVPAARGGRASDAPKGCGPGGAGYGGGVPVA
ncbi:hypothetical protein ACFWAX_29475, partial [Streptomyces sp. NPDC059956]